MKFNWNNFPEGVGGGVLLKNPFRGGGMDILWNYTFKFHLFSFSSNGPPSSAICVYNLSDINHVFDESSFKSFDNQAKQWVTVANNYQEYFKDVSIVCLCTPTILAEAIHLKKVFY